MSGSAAGTGTDQRGVVSESAYEYLLSELVALAAPSASDSEMNQRLEQMGYDVGYRYVEKAVANQVFLGTEPLDIVKYICKEFWEEMFKKKIDKLQTNHKGVFVLSDSKFKWLERFSSSDDMASKQAAARLLNFPCGILRGALANLGIVAAVNADFNSLPAVQFNIRAKTAS